MSKLTDKERQLLSGQNYAHLATLNHDGSPQVSPVWVDVEGDLIVINTDRARVKARNMSRDPRVALSIYDQQNPYDKASVRGKVVAMIDEGAAKHIDQLSEKYVGKPYQAHTPDEQRVIIQIEKV